MKKYLVVLLGLVCTAPTFASSSNVSHYEGNIPKTSMKCDVFYDQTTTRLSITGLSATLNRLPVKGSTQNETVLGDEYSSVILRFADSSKTLFSEVAVVQLKYTAGGVKFDCENLKLQNVVETF